MYNSDLLEATDFVTNYDDAVSTESCEPMKWSANLRYDGQLIAHACNTTDAAMTVVVFYKTGKGRAILQALAAEDEASVEAFVELTVECSMLG